jgi:rhomboid family GlyGly-CTERM serine protease
MPHEYTSSSTLKRRIIEPITLAQLCLLLIPVIGLISLFLPNVIFESLVFHTQLIASGEYWRFISGHFVYNSWQHWLINTSGLALLFLIFKCIHNAKAYLYAICFLLCWISSGLLLFSEELVWYIGFSGVLSGLYIYGACTVFNSARTLSIGIILLFLGFTAIQLYRGELVSGNIAGLQSSSYAHALGITGGFLLSSIVAAVNMFTTSDKI